MLLEYGCKVTLIGMYYRQYWYMVVELLSLFVTPFSIYIDNYSNSFPRVFEHMKKLAGDKADKMTFVKVKLIDHLCAQSGNSALKWITSLHSVISMTVSCSISCSQQRSESMKFAMLHALNADLSLIHSPPDMTV